MFHNGRTLGDENVLVTTLVYQIWSKEQSCDVCLVTLTLAMNLVHCRPADGSIVIGAAAWG